MTSREAPLLPRETSGGMSTTTLWLARFTREHTTMETRCLLFAPTEDEARATVLNEWSPDEEYEDLIIERVLGSSTGILRWWEEPW